MPPNLEPLRLERTWCTPIQRALAHREAASLGNMDRRSALPTESTSLPPALGRKALYEARASSHSGRLYINRAPSAASNPNLEHHAAPAENTQDFCVCTAELLRIARKPFM